MGPWLAAWAEGRFRREAGLRVLSRHQWTPELAADIATVDAVLFLDCAANGTPGEVRIVTVDPGGESPALATHQQDASQLLQLSLDLYGSAPRSAKLITVGAGSTELREGFSDAVTRALPEACRLIAITVNGWLTGEEIP